MNARTLIFAVCTSAPLACSDPELEPVTFANVCGEGGPIRALELAEDHDLDSTQRIGDRLYHHIGRVETLDGSNYTGLTDRRTWSTGLCGESPIHVADGIFEIYTKERWPGVLLGCTRAMGLVSFDPAGLAPPHPLLASATCSLEWTDHGIVAFPTFGDDAAGPLLLYPFPDDPRRDTSEAIVLVPQVLPDDVTIHPDAAYAITTAHELVRVDLVSLAVTSVQSQVRSFSLSADERYLVWQDGAMTGGTPGAPEGIVLLRDDLTGSSVALGIGRTLGNELRWADRGLLRFSHETDQVYTLATLDFVEVPPNHYLDDAGPLDDGRWLTQNNLIGSGPYLSTLDLSDGTLEPLFARSGQFIGRDTDSALVLDVTDCCTEVPLFRVPLDGSPPQRIAERATQVARLVDPHRLVTLLEIGELGTLALVDTDTRAEQRIDGSVSWTSLSVLPSPESMLVTYAVHDGDRSGVWLADLPPAP